MFDLNELETYKEGNRLEAKRALGRDGQGELPRSVWETVSAFANTSGGVIVLGATERKDDGSLVVHGIPKAGKVLDDFWNAALSDKKLSARFLRDSDATVETVDGKDVVVIRVPWVDRHMRPVYIDNDLFGGTFRRTHTGDHQCKREEILSMLRDSDTSSQDSKVVERARVEDLDWGTVERYRNLFRQTRDGSKWNSYDDKAFLRALGAAGVGDDGKVHPTGAGLLMFGKDRWITDEFPHYFLDYRQEAGAAERWADRFTSQPGFCRFDRRRSAEIGRNGYGSAKSAIISHLSQLGPAKRAELETVTGLGTSRVNDLLRELIASGHVVAEGATRSRRYRIADK